MANLRGLATLSKREIVRFLIVAHQTVFPPLVSAALFLLIFGLSVGSRFRLEGREIPYITYLVPGLLVMYLISGSFENTSSSLFIARWHNHIQEVLLSPLSYFEMVLGLLTGGLARGLIVTAGVYAIAECFTDIPPAHPWIALFFMISISVVFSCAGMIAALWAKDFGMLSVWNTYLITPAVFLGGVFSPVELLPSSLRWIGVWNPLRYLVSGMRYAVIGVEEAPPAACAAVALAAAVFFFLFTVHLFRIGYRLRT